MGKIDSGGVTPPSGGRDKPSVPVSPGKTFESLGPPQRIPSNLGKLKKENPAFYHKLMNALITGLAMKMVQDLQKQEKKRQQDSHS